MRRIHTDNLNLTKYVPVQYLLLLLLLLLLLYIIKKEVNYTIIFKLN